MKMGSWGIYKKCKDGKCKAKYFKNNKLIATSENAYSAPMHASGYDINRFLGRG